MRLSIYKNELLLSLAKRSRLLLAASVTFVLLMPGLSMAELGGHKLYVVPGFGGSGDATEGLKEASDGRFKFDNNNRIEDENIEGPGLSRKLYNYLRGRTDTGEPDVSPRCPESCILMSLSTGDLIVRHLIANQEIWSEEEGLEPLNIVATIDFVGAGGGVELANWVVAENLDPTYWGQVLGLLPTSISEVIIDDFIGPLVRDLPVHVARTISPYNDEPVPRFRVSVLLPIPIYGTVANDSLVSAHSTCGLSRNSTILSSCSNDVDYAGVTVMDGLNTVGPGNGAVANLWDYHYPVLMGLGYSHFLAGERVGTATHIKERIYKQGVGFEFDTDERVVETQVLKSYWVKKKTWWGSTYYVLRYKWENFVIFRKQWVKDNSLTDTLAKAFQNR